MADFHTAYAPLKQHEGGWCHDPVDKGGETYAGIARAFFPSWSGWQLVDAAKNHPAFSKGAKAFSAHLASLCVLQDAVSNWYHAYWWKPLGLGNLPQDLANELFEQAVNLGKAGVGRYLQRICNAFNYDKGSGNRLFADLAEDGAIGPRTLAALSIILEKRSPAEELVHACNCMQGAHYIGLAARNPSQRKFTTGWMTRTHCE